MADGADKYFERVLNEPAMEVASRARKRRISTALSAVAMATAVSAIAGTSNMLFKDGGALTELTTRIGDSGERSNDVFVSRISEIDQQLQAVRKAQATISQLPSSEQSAVLQNALIGRVDGLEKRLHALESALMSNPEKALSVPLMRRDLDNMRETNAQSLNSIKASVDQIYDLSKWLLGALAVGVLSLAIANFFTKK